MISGREQQPLSLKEISKLPQYRLSASVSCRMNAPDEATARTDAGRFPASSGRANPALIIASC